MKISEIAAGTLFGFKAWHSGFIPDCTVESGKPSEEWSAIYPQFTFERALAYLPNQWERGHQTAYILSLRTITKLTILTCCDKSFEDGSLCSKEKSLLVRREYSKLKDQLQHGHTLQLPPLPPDLPLMDALGALSLVLAARDAEGFELIVPRALFHPNIFQARPLFTFEQSTTRPLTIGRVVGCSLPRDILDDTALLADRLSSALEERQSNALLAQILAADSSGRTWLPPACADSARSAVVGDRFAEPHGGLDFMGLIEYDYFIDGWYIKGIVFWQSSADIVYAHGLLGTRYHEYDVKELL